MTIGNAILVKNIFWYHTFVELLSVFLASMRASDRQSTIWGIHRSVMLIIGKIKPKLLDTNHFISFALACYR